MPATCPDIIGYFLGSIPGRNHHQAGVAKVDVRQYGSVISGNERTAYAGWKTALPSLRIGCRERRRAVLFAGLINR